MLEDELWGSLLAVLNDQIRPPIKIQNRRNKQTYNTYAFTTNILPHVLETWYFAGDIHEIHVKYEQKAQFGKRKAEIRKEIKEEGPPMHQTWAKHLHGSHLDLARSLPEQGGGKRASPRCGRTTPKLTQPHLALVVVWRHAEAI